MPAANGTLFSHSQYWTGKNLDQIAGAVTDTGVDTQSLPTPGELAGDVVASPLEVGDRGIDFVQDRTPLPSGVDHAIDVAQRPVKTVIGAEKTMAAEAVDGGVEVFKKGVGRVKEAWDRLTD